MDIEKLKAHLDVKLKELEKIGYPADEAQQESWVECGSSDCLAWGSGQGTYEAYKEIRDLL